MVDTSHGRRKVCALLLLLSLLSPLACWANPQQRRLQHRSTPFEGAQVPGRDVVPHATQDLLTRPQSPIGGTEPSIPADVSVAYEPPQEDPPLPDDEFVPENITPLEILIGVAVLIFLVAQGFWRRRRV